MQLMALPLLWHWCNIGLCYLFISLSRSHSSWDLVFILDLAHADITIYSSTIYFSTNLLITEIAGHINLNSRILTNKCSDSCLISIFPTGICRQRWFPCQSQRWWEECWTNTKVSKFPCSSWFQLATEWQCLELKWKCPTLAVER